MSKGFQLLDEPWIPIEWLDGTFEELGLLRVFEDAANIRRIVHASPLVTFALYRLLFAIFHQAIPITGTHEWSESWDEADAHERVGGYLEAWRHRFDLFDAEAPFWQVPDLTTDFGSMSWSKLAAELNDNNNKVLFDHTRTKSGSPLATPAQVARLLVACQMLSVGAGKSGVGYNVNAVLATSLLVIPEADNLRDTLLANVRARRTPGDLPIWEQAVPKVADIIDANSRQPPRTYAYVGLANRLTWLTRAIRIEPPDETGYVSSIVFGAGLRPEVPESDRDPWVAYRVSKEGKWVPQRLDPDRAVWRDLQAIAMRSDEGFQAAAAITDLGKLLDNDRPFPETWTLLLGGQAADKAKLEGFGQERWRLPDVALRNPRAGVAILNATVEAEDGAVAIRKGLNRLARDILTTDKERNLDKKAVNAVADGFPTMDMYWTKLERAFATFLQELDSTDDNFEPTVDQARANWYVAIADAISFSADATRAVLGNDAKALRAWAITGPRFAALGLKHTRLATELQGGAM